MDVIQAGAGPVMESAHRRRVRKQFEMESEVGPVLQGAVVSASCDFDQLKHRLGLADHHAIHGGHDMRQVAIDDEHHHVGTQRLLFGERIETVIIDLFRGGPAVAGFTAFVPGTAFGFDADVCDDEVWVSLQGRGGEAGAVLEALAARGVDEATMIKIAGANFMRMLPEI